MNDLDLILDSSIDGWCDLLETGLNEIDVEHKMFFDVIDGVFEAANKGYKEFNLAIDDILKHISWHFKSEEDYMKSKKISKKYIEIHQKIHSQCIHQLEKIKKSIIRQNSEDEIIYESSLANNFTYFIKNWLVFHILSEDYKIAQLIDYMNDGLSSDKAFVKLNENVNEKIDILSKTLLNLLKIYEYRNNKLLNIEADVRAKLGKKEKQLQETILENKKRSITDELTGIYNRRQAMSMLKEIFKEYQEPIVSIIQIDLDNFKGVNDTYGHHSGDLVLKKFALSVNQCIKTNDLCNKYSYQDDELVHFFRSGGDEFLIVLQKFTPEESILIANDIHAAINNIKVTDENDNTIWLGSASMGVAFRNTDDQHYEDVLKTADKYLYKAKEDGRNCVRSKLHELNESMGGVETFYFLKF